MNDQKLEEALSGLPLYIYAWVEPESLEFSDRVRWICQHECAMYGTTWACPPGVGTVAECKKKCLSYNKCLLISTISEVADISDLQATLATRGDHEAVTDQWGIFSVPWGRSPIFSPPRPAPSAPGVPFWTESPAVTRIKCTPVWRARVSISFQRWRQTGWNSSTDKTW